MASDGDPYAYKRDAALQKRLAAEVESLAKLPGNGACADCSDGRRVRFVSVTLGVFLCNRCYGLHRALGAHVTRTKCLGLDTWHPDEVALLRRVGNTVAAGLYLAAAGTDKPTAATADREVARHIKEKYELRRFVAAPGTTPPPPPAPNAPPVDLLGGLQPPAATATAPWAAFDAFEPLTSYEEANGKVGTGPPIDSAGLAQQTTGGMAMGAEWLEPWPQAVAGGGAALQPCQPPASSTPLAGAQRSAKDEIMALFGPG